MWLRISSCGPDLNAIRHKWDMKMDFFFFFSVWNVSFLNKKRRWASVFWEIKASSRYCTHAVAPEGSSLTILWVMAFGCWLAPSVSRWPLGFVYIRARRSDGGREEGREELWAWDCFCLKRRGFFFHIRPSFHLIFFFLLHNNPLVYEHLWALEGSEVIGRRSRVSFGQEEELKIDIWDRSLTQYLTSSSSSSSQHLRRPEQTWPLVFLGESPGQNILFLIYTRKAHTLFLGAFALCPSTPRETSQLPLSGLQRDTPARLVSNL